MGADKIALCVDEPTFREPAFIGLDGEALDAQEWLDVYTAGDEARRRIGEGGAVSEVWVVSCEDVDPINLAATIKADNPGLAVRLVDFEGGGSLLSRAYNASIDEVMEKPAFLKRYAERKMRSGFEARRIDVPAVETAHAGLVEDSAAPRFASVVADEVERSAAPVCSIAPARSRGFVLPVVSGSGGAGKSVVSVVSAFIAARLGFRVLLLDYDLQFGDARLLAGRREALSLDVALSHPEQLEQELRRNLNPTILAAPARLEDAEQVAKSAPSFIDELVGAFDVIIANTGGAWAEYHAALLERSSAGLFLIDQRASSLRACRHALELCARCGIATGPFQFAVNRCGKGAPLSAADVSAALRGLPVYEIADGGPDVEEYLAAGEIEALIDSANPLCESLGHVLSKVLPGAGLLAADRIEVPTDKRAARKRARHAGRRKGWGL